MVLLLLTARDSNLNGDALQKNLLEEEVPLRESSTTDEESRSSVLQREMSRSIVILAVFAAVCLIEAEGLKVPSGKGIRAKIGHARDSQLFVTSAEVSQRENIEKNAKGLLFMPKIESETLIQSVLAGATVSLAMIPEAVSFAFVAGVSPLVALWSTVLLGFTAAAFGGRQ